MPSVKWAQSALDDVHRLYKFLAEKNIEAAQKAVQAIRSSLNILAQHPEVGRPAHNMDPNFREHIISYGHSGYLALYHYDGETAVILAVRHQLEIGSMAD
ncbi:MAG: type II toxin-antitoxin system RelE/ParE family toxin [Thermodesulfobacteriota bacterium]